MIYFVRHAKAGSRSDWTGDDRQRPLSGKGRKQSALLADRLAPVATGDLVSSPYLRCVQTIEPLAARLGRKVRTDERLAEEMGFEGALALLAEVPDGSVLCSHGDVIPDTMGALLRRGCRFDNSPDWRKGTVWVLSREGGEVVSALVWPVPDDY
jgi:8-oxo-dGTP diphosphatase